jgi:hypothetical protein
MRAAPKVKVGAVQATKKRFTASSPAPTTKFVDRHGHVHSADVVMTNWTEAARRALGLKPIT